MRATIFLFAFIASLTITIIIIIITNIYNALYIKLMILKCYIAQKQRAGNKCKQLKLRQREAASIQKLKPRHQGATIQVRSNYQMSDF